MGSSAAKSRSCKSLGFRSEGVTSLYNISLVDTSSSLSNLILHLQKYDFLKLLNMQFNS